jgi:nitrilase
MRLGIAQLRPAWGNKAATTKIVIDAIARAAADGIELLAFSETFLSGYPFWVCRSEGAATQDNIRQQRAFAQFLEQGVEIGGPEIAAIRQAAGDFRVSVYLGVNERGAKAGRGTIWCSLVTIDAALGVLGAHRKLMPTHDERMAWGIGDAAELRTYPFGEFRVGGLNCWENWMPLARNALYEDGEDVHICVWPGNAAAVTHDLPLFVAQEGRVWCASVAGLLSMADVPEDFEFYQDLIAAGHDVIFEGGSMIVGPDQKIAARIAPGEAGIVGFDIDMASVRRARQDFDPAGHYARPDIFRVGVQRVRLGGGANAG